MSLASEYLPEKPKAFSIAPASPDLGQLILSARDDVVEDNSLSLGARLMFVRILDLSVRQASNVAPGVVTISQTKLSEKFQVSLRTVWNWKAELLRAGVIWMTSQPMPNAWPIDTYHISAIHPPKHSGDKTTAEGLWGNGARQRPPLRVGLGARQPGQVQIPGTGVRSNQLRVEKNFQLSPKSSILPANATARRKPLPAAAETGCGGEPQPVATGGRNQLRRGAETGCEPPPKQVAAGSSNQLRATAEADCEHKKALGQGSSHSEGGKGLPAPDSAFEDWKIRIAGPPGYPTLASKLEKELSRIRVKLMNAGESEKSFWQCRADFIRELLDGGKPPQAPKPVRSAAPAPKIPALPRTEAKRLWDEAKAKAGYEFPSRPESVSATAGHSTRGAGGKGNKKPVAITPPARQIPTNEKPTDAAKAAQTKNAPV